MALGGRFKVLGRIIEWGNSLTRLILAWKVPLIILSGSVVFIVLVRFLLGRRLTPGRFNFFGLSFIILPKRTAIDDDICYIREAVFLQKEDMYERALVLCKYILSSDPNNKIVLMYQEKLLKIIGEGSYVVKKDWFIHEISLKILAITFFGFAIYDLIVYGPMVFAVNVALYPIFMLSVWFVTTLASIPTAVS